MCLRILQINLFPPLEISTIDEYTSFALTPLETRIETVNHLYLLVTRVRFGIASTLVHQLEENFSTELMYQGGN